MPAGSLADEDGIRGWIEVGGIAVTTFSQYDLEQTIHRASADLIPAVPTGTVQVPLWAILGTPKTDDAESITVIKCEPKPGTRVLASWNGIPLAVTKRVGLGQVICIPFDFSSRSLRDRPEYLEFWREILQAAASRERVVNFLDERFLANTTEVSSRSNPPSVGLVSAFLGLYILLLVPGNYLVLRRLRRREWAWATVPGLVLVFCVAAFAVGSASRGRKPTLTSVAVVEMASDSRHAVYTGKLSLYSPVRGRYDLVFDDPDILVSDQAYGAGAGVFPGLNVNAMAGREVSLPDTGVYTWSTRTFAVEGVKALDGTISARLSTDGARVRGVIANNLPFELNDCVLYGDKFRAGIGTLKPGGTVEIYERFGDGKSLERTLPYEGRGPELLKRGLSRVPSSAVGALVQPGELVLVGYPDRPMWNLQVNGGKMLSTDAAIMFVHIYPKWEERPNGRIAGSVGGFVTDVSTPEGVWANAVGEGPKLQTRSVPVGLWETTMRFDLPQDLDPVELDRLALACRLGEWWSRVPERSPKRQYLINFESEVYDYSTRSWRQIGEVHDTGDILLPISDPANVIGPGGVVKIRIPRHAVSETNRIHGLRLRFEGQAK